MRLDDCVSQKLLPLFMRRDAFNIALCNCIDDMVKELWTKLQAQLRFWDYIDYMTEAQLDECAKELCIHWYRYTATIEKKRDIIKNYKEVKSKLGTVWATEYILGVYFGEATIVEYWEYGGKKKHFKIQTWNTNTVNKDADEFLKIMNKIKRKSSVLDYIEIQEKSTNEIIYILTPGTGEIIENNEIGGKM